MVVTVPEGISKPYSDNNGVILGEVGGRQAPVTSREEIQRMLQSADLVHADEVPVEGATAGDIDLDHFKAFFREPIWGLRLERHSKRSGFHWANC